MVIDSTKLLERYPELEGDDVDLSIAIVCDNKVQIVVTMENDERTDEQKVLTISHGKCCIFLVAIN